MLREAVSAGDYASTSEAVRDCRLKRLLQLQEIAALKADIDRGLADVVAGRVKDFDPAAIVERGKQAIGRPYALRLTDTA